MATLRELKSRIGSIRSTLKITSAMKLVASAKFSKAQRAIDALRPYERTLSEILAAVAPAETDAGPGTGRMAVVAIASNSALCGGFNAAVLRKTLETLRACPDGADVYPIGRKIAEPLRRAGYQGEDNYDDLVAHPSPGRAADLARTLAARFHAGEIARVVLVYNRFVSISCQTVTVEPYLPFTLADRTADGTTARPGAKGQDAAGQPKDRPGGPLKGQPEEPDWLLEPSVAELYDRLLPQVLEARFYAVLLESSAAEHAARTLAMQTASDNAENLLSELSLEYNKGRQQKITAEILDLRGGSTEA